MEISYNVKLLRNLYFNKLSGGDINWWFILNTFFSRVRVFFLEFESFHCDFNYHWSPLHVFSGKKTQIPMGLWKLVWILIWDSPVNKKKNLYLNYYSFSEYYLSSLYLYLNALDHVLRNSKLRSLLFQSSRKIAMINQHLMLLDLQIHTHTA